MCPVTARGTVDPVHTRGARCSLELNGLLAVLSTYCLGDCPPCRLKAVLNVLVDA